MKSLLTSILLAGVLIFSAASTFDSAETYPLGYTDADATSTGKGKHCRRYRNDTKRLHCYAHRRCSNRRVNPCFVNAGIHYRLRAWQKSWLRRVSFCESRHNPYARNPSGASGLFQFLPSTWGTTPYGRRSIWSARYQSLSASWMLARAGRSGEWTCQ